MLSQNPSTVQQHQRQHRRQQSTPNVFDPSTQVQNQQPIARRQHASHRRGMSSDVRQRRQSPTAEYQITNQGFQQHNQQHILRETQQQRLFRPGQPQPYLSFDNDENFDVSHLVPQQSQTFDIGCQQSSYMTPHELQASYQQYSGPVNNSIKVDSNGYSHFEATDLPLYPDGLATNLPYLNFSTGFENAAGQQDWGVTVKPNRSPSRRRISGSIAGRVAQFEGIVHEQPVSRPITPPTQTARGYFPDTPHSTPYNHLQRSQPQRFSESYDESMEETIKPARNASRAKNVFEEMREQVEANRPPSPPATAPIPSTAKFDSVIMPSSAKFPGSSPIKTESSYQMSYDSPSDSAHDSRPSSPEMSQSDFYGASYDDDLSIGQSRRFEPLPGTQSEYASQTRRSESVESIILEETMTDTGITIDDIAMYISSPSSESADQKWTCLFPGCSKKFGRKENIKSHVQTHLGDRQYQCPHCKKCFVRQHDLKRHAKIHSGIKPYPCACGNSFARHDALTRHRQRGMCIGAFDGIVKKTVKRGRPRKARPEDEERLDKASRTRSKVAASNASSSEYSESSYGASPANDFDDVLDDKPFGDYNQDQQMSMMDNSEDFQPQFSAPHTPLNRYTAQEENPSASYISPAIIQNEFQTNRGPSFANSHYRTNSIVSLPSTTSPYHSTPIKQQSAFSPAGYSSPAPELIVSSSSPVPMQHCHSTHSSQPSPYSQTHDQDLVELSHLSMGGSDSLFLEHFGMGGDEVMMKFEDPFVVDGQGIGLGMEMGGALGMDMFGNLEVARDVFFGSP